MTESSQPSSTLSGEEFDEQGKICIRARQAADRAGATMMDRPEWVAVHPQTKEVYVTLTNNDRRGTAPAAVNTPDGTTTAGTARPPVDGASARSSTRPRAKTDSP